MQKIKSYIKLMRPKHYLKNGLVLVPLFFSRCIFDRNLAIRALLGFVSFSLMSSVVYIVNDLNDMEADRENQQKRNRPLASGAVKRYEAVILAVIIFFASVAISYMAGHGMIWLILYLILNLAYSFKLKQIPILDVTILALGYLIRLVYGAAITDTGLSFWICMTALTFSFYMGLGKRRNELNKLGENAPAARTVLRSYNSAFLDKCMYVCMGLAIMFYALWSGDSETVQTLETDLQMWTVPIVIILAMKYSLDIEKGGLGDPMEVIVSDKGLILIGIVYIIVISLILYV